MQTKQAETQKCRNTEIETHRNADQPNHTEYRFTEKQNKLAETHKCRKTGRNTEMQTKQAETQK